MSLVLQVDGDRWRAHLRATALRTPGLVPVAKGNGYGFGLASLARRVQWLADQIRPGTEDPSLGDTIAVGTYDEVAAVASRCEAAIVVLTPWRPFIALPQSQSSRLIHTIGRQEDLLALAELDPHARVVLERATSMRRHGFDAAGLRHAARAARKLSVRVEGVAFHLPLTAGAHLSEVHRLMTDVVAADLAPTTVWVSHLSPEELATLRATYADFRIRPRIGTELWLGDRGALRPRATVLDVHPIDRGELFGYRGRAAPRAGHLVVVSGGTAHGIGLEAPTGELSFKSRAASIARGGLDAAGLVRSPFLIDGKQRLFAEPPHMQASMLFLPVGSRVPQVGDRIDVRLRFTATTFDRVELS